MTNTPRQRSLLSTGLVKVPHPILRQRAHQVRRFDDRLAKTLARMGLVLLREGGVGIAAPQVGDRVRAIIAIDPATNVVYTMVNPRLVPVGDERTTATEGCLSLPGQWVRDLPRHRRVRVDYQDQRGRWHRLDAADDLARVLQHEADHLDGILITDRAPATHLVFDAPPDVAAGARW